MATEEQDIITTLENLERKTKHEGKVIKITLAGAVVDFGMEVPGVVHISQLQKDPVNRVEDVVEIGQEVTVWVKRVFPNKKRVELTMVEPLPLEWREIKEDMVITGTVTRLENYGAFVDIGAERPGLVHISELAHGYVKKPGDAVQEGQEVDVKVLKVNRRKKQIKLSIKALQDKPEQMAQSGRRKPKQQRPQEPQETQENVPTAMEMALREAMEKSSTEDEGQEKNETSNKKKKGKSDELDDLLSRTLDRRVKTASN